MNIVLSGYGQMGRMIETVCHERGHTISCILNQAVDYELQKEKILKANLLIDFSQPDSAMDNIRFCLENHVPIVVGTTGWHQHLEEVKQLCDLHQGSLFYAPNFSLGMNIVFRLNKQLAKMLRNSDYHFSLKEVHHTRKLDAPSGTAIHLASDIISIHNSLKSWQIDDSNDKTILPVFVERVGEVNGIHEISARSVEDLIVIRHEAFSRRGFAVGAVLAAEYLQDKKGLHNMEDLLLEQADHQE